jgi:phosphate-selective porin OprO and OprP
VQRISSGMAGLVAGIVITVAGAGQLSAQASQDSTTQQLLQRIDALDQQTRITARKFELYQDSVANAAKTKPSVTAGAGGFQLKSADGNFVIKFRGYLQADGRFFLDDSSKVLTNDFLLRRVRPILEGTIYKYYDFRIMSDFGGSAPTIFDAYFQARFKPEFAVRAGKFKPGIDLERLQSATDIKFVERGFPTNLAPSRDVGLQVGGDIHGGLVSYSAAIFNGVPDLASGLNDISDSKDLVGRLFITPFATRANSSIDLGFGVGASTGKELGTISSTALASYRAPGQATIFKYNANSPATIAGTTIANGRRSRIAPQAYLNLGSLGLQGEYIISRQVVTRDTAVALTQTRRLEHKAYQVSGSYVLTGEKNSYASITPKKQFDPLAGGWGAFELVARYGQIDFDDASFPFFANPASSVTKAKAWGVGLNWYLARNVKIAVDFEKTTFDGGAASNGDRPSEKYIATRFQTSF